MPKKKRDSKSCPECGHNFQGNGWDGIDAHWRSKHEQVMPYGLAWPLIQSGRYKHPNRREDANQAAFRVVMEVTKH